MFRFGKLYENLSVIQAKPWLGKIKPFKILNNVYFVGTYQASCHLIDTGKGLIMIDPGYSATAYLVKDSICQLGFKLQDIKYIINTHHHKDHIQATAEFVNLSGAKSLLGRYDVEKASTYFTPDIIVDDGDTLTLGNTTIRFLHTPGHTKGTISFFFDAVENGKTYHVGSFGGAGLNTMKKETFDFEGCREAYFNSLERLRKEKVDVFLGNHTWNNDTFTKAQKLFETGENAFIDDTIWLKFLETYEKRLKKLIAEETTL